jgi:hypothetical protein
MILGYMGAQAPQEAKFGGLILSFDVYSEDLPLSTNLENKPCEHQLKM